MTHRDDIPRAELLARLLDCRALMRAVSTRRDAPGPEQLAACVAELDALLGRRMKVGDLGRIRADANMGTLLGYSAGDAVRIEAMTTSGVKGMRVHGEHGTAYADECELDPVDAEPEADAFAEKWASYGDSLSPVGQHLRDVVVPDASDDAEPESADDIMSEQVGVTGVATITTGDDASGETGGPYSSRHDGLYRYEERLADVEVAAKLNRQHSETAERDAGIDRLVLDRDEIRRSYDRALKTLADRRRERDKARAEVERLNAVIDTLKAQGKAITETPR